MKRFATATLACVGLLLSGTACSAPADEVTSNDGFSSTYSQASTEATDIIDTESKNTSTPRDEETWEASNRMLQSCQQGRSMEPTHFHEDDLQFFQSATLYSAGGVCVKTDDTVEQDTAVVVTGGGAQLHAGDVEAGAMVYARGGGAVATLQSIKSGAIAIARGGSATVVIPSAVNMADGSTLCAEGGGARVIFADGEYPDILKGTTASEVKAVSVEDDGTFVYYDSILACGQLIPTDAAWEDSMLLMSR